MVTPHEVPACRDSPHDAQHFAAYAFFARSAITHHTFRCAEDGDSETVQHLLQFLGATIIPVAGPTGTLDVANHLFAFRAVFQIDAQNASGLARFRAILE